MDQSDGLFAILKRGRDTIRAYFRFYAELNDHLPPERRMKEIEHEFQAGATVKDRIEALGVPHTEVELILVNGQPVDFSYLLRHGERVSVYPVFESIDLGPLLKLRPRPLRDLRFVLDTHLGRLATYLRMLGFDALYRNDYTDRDLAQVEQTERRILLTRDRGLLKRREITRGYYVRETEPRRQTVEVLRRFDLFGAIEPFRRCLRCGTLLEPVCKQEMLERLPPKTMQYYDEFQHCPACERVYWKGSHYARMSRLVEWIRSQQPPDTLKPAQ